MASSSSRKIILKSADNELYEIGEKAAMLSQTIKNLIEDIGDSDKPILLQNVTSKVLPKVIEYCNKHAEKENTDDDDVDDFLKDWDADFLNVDQDTLFDLMLAANYLDIKSLLDSTCQCVADMMKGKTAEEIREHFNIRNDYTPEQEEEVRKENQWAFE